jgi:hypothetical protein
MPKREYDFPSLLPDELSSIACRLSPSVQVVQLPSRYPGGVVRPAWWGFALIDGQVHGTATTDCPLLSYHQASERLAQDFESREPAKPGYLQTLLALVGGGA